MWGTSRSLPDWPFIFRCLSKLRLDSCNRTGPAGCGKSALAATIAQKSEFPFIKLISAENMVGYSDAAKIQYMNKVFTDAHKSPFSVVVVDSIETIIDYIPIGPRFSAPVLVALKVLMRKLPPKVT